jgi:uncharacterized membrane protein YhaH (DUF805 family)
MGSTTWAALGSALIFTLTGLAVFLAAAGWLVRRWRAPDAVLAAAVLGVAIIVAATMH